MRYETKLRLLSPRVTFFDEIFFRQLALTRRNFYFSPSFNFLRNLEFKERLAPRSTIRPQGSGPLVCYTNSRAVTMKRVPAGHRVMKARAYAGRIVRSGERRREDEERGQFITESS